MTARMTTGMTTGMIGVAWHTLRARWLSFTGSFLALGLGVALFASAGLVTAAALRGPDDPPQWYMTPPVVVAGPDRAGVTPRDPAGPPASPSLPPGERGFVPAGAPAALSAVDGVAEVVVDQAGYARFGPADRAHPWSAAALHPYRLVAGDPPARDDQLVLPQPAGARPGEVITVATAHGPRQFTVSGIIDSPAEPALYVTDATAERLAGGRVAAVALLPEPGADPDRLAVAARAALDRWPGLRVLTGDARRGAELDPDAGLLAAAASLLGSMAGLAGFVAVIVVAGTFAFTVAQRRREFALLRTAGATPRQVRRLVTGEAWLVGALAGLAGSLLSLLVAPAFARWLSRNGLAPAGFTVEAAWWPLAAAFGAGLLVAWAGAWVAARRAGRVRPVEVLREAATDERRRDTVRWIAGPACLAGVVPMIPLLSTPEGTAYLLVVVMLLVLGGTLLLPVLIRPISWPLTAGRGPIALLARAGVRAEHRRYAATVAPVLVTIGLAGGALAGAGTIAATEATSLRDQLTAPALIVPAGGARLPDTVAGLAGRVPGVTAAVPVKATTVFDAPAGSVRQRTAWYVAGPAVGRVLRLSMVAGSVGGLAGDTVAVSDSMAGAHGWRVGDQARLWLGDGALAEPRVVAVYEGRLGLPDTFLPWSLATAHTTVPMPDLVYLDLDPGTDLTVTGPLIESAVAPLGGTLTGTRAHLSTLDEEFDRLARLALLAVLGMALVYTGIAIANTQLMATTGRVRELRALRLAGATRGQVLRLVGREATMVAAAGTAAGALVTAATLVTVYAALARLAGSVPIRAPWWVVLAIAGCCMIITVTASVVPAALALRRERR